jgi:hypothetical protein
MGASYIYVPVKSSQLNNVKMDIPDISKEAAPKTYVNYDAKISNLGYYKGMFELRFEHDENLTVSTPNKVIVLDPAETKNVNIQVLTEEKLFDIGTPYEIKIYALSSGDPNPMHVGTIRVISKGMYISPLIFIILIPIIIITFIIFAIVFVFKERRDREIHGKPSKPWTLPEEKNRLQQLKKKDAEAYQKELDRMKKEYQSSVQSWKKNQNKEINNFFSIPNVLSRSKKKSDSNKNGSESSKTPKTEKPKKKEVKRKKKPESEQKSEIEELTTEESDQDTNSKNQTKDSVSNTVISGLKKWFTVPEEEKQNKEKPRIQEEKSVELSRENGSMEQKDSKDDYEKELKRIEKEQIKLRAEKAKQQKKIQKQKAMIKIMKAQEKQKKKLEK